MDTPNLRVKCLFSQADFPPLLVIIILNIVLLIRILFVNKGNIIEQTMELVRIYQITSGVKRQVVRTGRRRFRPPADIDQHLAGHHKGHRFDQPFIDDIAK